jgi:uncharacterized protein YdhG (YjbR/CyaY superfamily)
MRIEATSVADYLANVPEHQLAGIQRLVATIKTNLPAGFQECLSYGMIGYVVPHTLYPAGYHCDPKLPLPFLSVAAQKNFIAIYHMGIYSNPELYNWFTEEYEKLGLKKLDIGKSCMRFKKTDDIPFELIGLLVSKMNPTDWITQYEAAFKKSK